MPHVQINSPNGDYQIYYRRYPETENDPEIKKRPQVLLLMGMGGTHGLWKFQSEYFQQFCQVCAMDNRGTGYSGHPSGEMRWTTHCMAQDALAVLEHLGWEKVHIIGISMGGMIAQELAILVPQRVASLALLATYSSALYALPTTAALVDLARSMGLLTRDLREQGKASMRLNFPDEWLEGRRCSEFHEGKEVSNSRWVNKAFILMTLEVPLELKSKGMGSSSRTRTMEMFKQLLAVLTHHVSGARCATLRRLGVPVLVMTGSEDWLVRPVNSQIIADHFATKVEVLDGLGHGLIFQDALSVNEHLASHIQAGEDYFQKKPAVMSKL